MFHNKVIKYCYFALAVLFMVLINGKAIGNDWPGINPPNFVTGADPTHTRDSAPAINSAFQAAQQNPTNFVAATTLSAGYFKTLSPLLIPSSTNLQTSFNGAGRSSTVIDGQFNGPIEASIGEF